MRIKESATPSPQAGDGVREALEPLLQSALKRAAFLRHQARSATSGIARVYLGEAEQWEHQHEAATFALSARSTDEPTRAEIEALRARVDQFADGVEADTFLLVHDLLRTVNKFAASPTPPKMGEDVRRAIWKAIFEHLVGRDLRIVHDAYDAADNAARAVSLVNGER